MLNREFFTRFTCGDFSTLDLKLGVLLVDFCSVGGYCCVLPAESFSSEEQQELLKRGFNVEYTKESLKISW